MENIINDLYDVIEKRKLENNEGSYTNYLFKKGKEKILKKVGEECTEVIIASMKNNNKEEQVNEVCDLTYHLLVLLNELNIPLEDVCMELKNRRNKINNFKGERKAIDNI
ncbi:MAG: phosphoribosyl-ATP diphosphatase [Clostridium baratii]|uniref:Phosphoribosyl-ATP pyrophosphatase n=1 Tax=Clostridium baratii str. Sullivan TaxID=1415775 RepID=A0A0A7FSV4_9CLOT|nr:phosphoribosyl-ATP diphosphatase [Clostridium baratii]AIY82704.1 phosphoribosyl-ATP diphosphatase [Clostridium baratii str. Sullivan]MBS6005615.1 phosphoribosyl-ATP diphosphatase [Clostridium baratii]MDU1052681.1 phosphoribosyl-ATP diphosphatase [Clostridium baratii]MDU4910177.1 phosphoribosyl-ATP diphosphatase [Clostridium baratii]CUP28787.1 phosphoribosyl-ATP pyrophosphohydrolase [Clostridium baratii]